MFITKSMLQDNSTPEKKEKALEMCQLKPKSTNVLQKNLSILLKLSFVNIAENVAKCQSPERLMVKLLKHPGVRTNIPNITSILVQCTDTAKDGKRPHKREMA